MTFRPEKHAVAAIVIALAALLCWLIYYWVRVFMPPANAPEPAPAPAAAVPATHLDATTGRIATARLFGASAPATAAVQASSLRVQLKGVFAGKEDGFAIVNTGKAADEPVKLGAELMPGVTLQSVHPTHIVVNRGGILERVDLPEKGQPGAQPGAPRPTIANPRVKPGSTLVVPAGPSAKVTATIPPPPPGPPPPPPPDEAQNPPGRE